MSWVSLTVDVPEQQSDLTQGVMYDFGVAGLELREGGQKVMPQVRAPAAGETIVVGYFENRQAATQARQEIARRVVGARTALEPVVDRDWSLEWKKQIKSVTVGRLWVGPPWERDSSPCDKVRLFIEPKMAFGTGDHPTTRLCLAAVDEVLAKHPGATVLDVGTGTGVLAMAAKKLGAARTVGTDNDPVAIELALECAQENDIAGLELSTKPLRAVSGRFDLVVANILANTLIELAPQLAAKVQGRLVLAGVLVPQAEDVARAFVDAGLIHVGNTVDGEWVRLDFDGPRARLTPTQRGRAAKKAPPTKRAPKATKAPPTKRAPKAMKAPPTKRAPKATEAPPTKRAPKVKKAPPTKRAPKAMKVTGERRR